MIITMHQEVERLRDVIKAIEAENALKAQLKLNIEEQLKQLKRKTFARSKEDRANKDNSEEKRKARTMLSFLLRLRFPRLKSLSVKRTNGPRCRRNKSLIA